MAKGWDKEKLRHSMAKRFGKAPPYRKKTKPTPYPTPTKKELYWTMEKPIKTKPKPVYKQVDSWIKGTHFKINNKITIVARHEDTRSGFRHIADLYINGEKVDSVKVTYQNRTWESYQFQSVLRHLIEKTSYLTDKEKKIGNAFVREGHSDPNQFKSTAMVAKMGDIFGKTMKEKNDWKLRMLKAGLQNKGLSIPEDWDTLSEKTKQKRLDAIIKLMGKNVK